MPRKRWPAISPGTTKNALISSKFTTRSKPNRRHSRPTMPISNPTDPHPHTHTDSYQQGNAVRRKSPGKEYPAQARRFPSNEPAKVRSAGLVNPVPQDLPAQSTEQIARPANNNTTATLKPHTSQNALVQEICATAASSESFCVESGASASLINGLPGEESGESPGPRFGQRGRRDRAHAQPYPWIDKGVQKIRKQIHQQRKKWRSPECIPAATDSSRDEIACHRQPADARPGKKIVFRNDSSRQQSSELQSQDGCHGNQRIAKRAWRNKNRSCAQGPSRGAVRHVIAGKFFKHRAAHHPRQNRRQTQRQASPQARDNSVHHRDRKPAASQFQLRTIR